MELENNRVDFIDILKGIGIFLVIFGHHSTYLTEYIYSFHMPLFFFLSGLLHENTNNYFKFFIKKFKKLVIPYLFFSVTLFLFWLVIGRKFGESAILKTPILVAMNGIFISNNIEGFSSMEWGGPLWFLPCLFLVTNFYYFFCTMKKKYSFISLLFFILLSSFLYSDINLSKTLKIWHINTSFIAIAFYSYGHVFKGYFLKVKHFSWKLVLLLFIISYTVSSKNGRIDMNNNCYNNIFLFYISAFSGITYITLLIKNINLNNSFLKFLGQNTLSILAYHYRAFTLIKFFLIIILDIKYPENNLGINLIFSIVQLVIMIPVILILNKYFRYFIGKNTIKIIDLNR